MHCTNQYIIEYNHSEAVYDLLNTLGVIQYHLPMIQSYVVDIPDFQMKALDGVSQIHSIQKTSYTRIQII